ncbi:MAG: O-antigen ligase family protein, partial [Clostridia bacterium]|nr:O-antigen ligase family protein [Clostridia bacterium]
MLNIEKYDKNKIHSLIFTITCVFLLLQPVFDLLSYLHIRNYISLSLSTYAKPLIIGFINIALLLIYKRQIWQCAITYGGYLLLMVVHTYLLDGMLIERSIILHELRFMINILYLLLCFHDFRILYEEAPDKEYFISRLKRVLIAAFAFYIVLYLISVASGKASLTYEYSDPAKKGFKGWMDSGQIFGHTLCICLPFIVSTLLNTKFSKPIVRIICKASVVLPILTLCLIGTKVSYWISILVLLAQFVLELFFLIKEKKKSHIINALICLIIASTCLLAYPITP